MARKAEAVHLAGHHDIGKHEINSVELDLAQRRFGIFDPADGIAELLQQVGADGCDIRIVFDQQYGAAAAGFDGSRFFQPARSASLRGSNIVILVPLPSSLSTLTVPPA